MDEIGQSGFSGSISLGGETSTKIQAMCQDFITNDILIDSLRKAQSKTLKKLFKQTKKFTVNILRFVSTQIKIQKI